MTNGSLPDTPRARELGGFAIASLATLCLAALMVPMRDHVGNAAFALVLVLPVLGASVIGGRVAGVGTAIVAAMTFDFFLTQPYQSLKMDAGTDVATLVLLVVVSLSAAEIGIRTRRADASARASLSELHRLFRIADLSASDTELEDITSAVRAELIAMFHLDDCTYEAEPVGALPWLGRRGVIEGSTLRATPHGFALPATGIAIPVRGRGLDFGSLVLVPGASTSATAEQRFVAVALADELGVALATRRDGPEL